MHAGGSLAQPIAYSIAGRVARGSCAGLHAFFGNYGLVSLDASVKERWAPALVDG